MNVRSAQTKLSKSVRKHAVHLTTVEAGHAFDDLQPFSGKIGAARIVALGEATHGTREFFQLKHRLVEFLVAEHGFATFAIEANWPECEAVNDYVMNGAGDPGSALAGLYFWTWDTEEVLALIEWMRLWNAGDAPERQVRFAGIDAQFPSRAVSRLRAYLADVDAECLDTISPALNDMAELRLHGNRHDDATERHLSETTGSIRAHLHENEDTYVARSSVNAWRTACHHARILSQIDETRHAGSDAARFTARDRAIADNVDCLLQEAGNGGKVIVWAHNGHVTRDSLGMFDPDLETMGEVLAKRHGDEYVAVGFAFGEGSFQAMVQDGSGDWTLQEVTLGAPPAGSLDAVLMEAAQSPAFLLDLRQKTAELADWLNQELVTRECGAEFSFEEEGDAKVAPASRYDVLAFVPITTRARPNPTGHRPRR